MIPALPLLLTPSQAEDLTGLERKYLADLAKAGKVKIYRTTGNHRRYYKSSLLEYFNHGNER
jgi:excisionase family DNA binding protein